MERSYDYHSNHWDKYNDSPGSQREGDRDMNPSYDRQSILKCGYSSHGDYDDRLRDRAITDRREDPKKIFEDRRDDDEDDDDDYSSPPRKNSRSGSKGRYSPPAHWANSPENSRDSSWMDDETSLVVIHDVPDKITETEIRIELQLFGAPIYSVRLEADSGSKGTRDRVCYVEFTDVRDSSRWMRQQKGYLVIQGEKLQMTYSDRKLQHERDLADRGYRDHDHRDRHDRGDSRYDRGDRDRRPYHDDRKDRDDDRRSKWPHDRYERHDNGNDRSVRRKDKSIDRSEHHNKKTETMIVMGLDKRTTVSAIRTAFEYITHYAIVDIRLVKDKYGQSRGFCFVQWASVEECSQVLEYLKTATPRFHIENRQVQLDYSQPRHPEPQASSVSANAAAAAIEAARWSRIGGTALSSTGAAINTPEKNLDSSSRGKGYEQPSPHRSQMQVPMHPLTPAMPQQTPKFGSSVDPGRPKRYPTPDISTYQYDESSGYYYDRSTSLYYNSSTRYYYNSFTGVYLYWDQKTHNYVPVSSETQAAQVSSARESQKVEGESKPEKSKTAKQVAKDMERWAKAQNKKKDEYKRLMEGKNLSGLTKESATVDAGYSILENTPSEAERRAAVKDAYMKEEFFKKPSLPNAASKRSGEVMSTLQAMNTSESSAIPGLSSYENGSDSEEEEDSQAPQLSIEEQVEKLTDWKKMTCLLCRRAFTSKDALDRHRSLSDLHKQNVEALRVKSKAISLAKKSADVQPKYRDRAAERRSKYGIADPPPKKSRYLAPVPYEQPTKDGLDDTNIGNKMLQKMGWKSGSGLGKSQSGITVPIMAEQRTQGAGLGMRGSTYGTKAGDSYRDALKQRTAMRYHEID